MDFLPYTQEYMLVVSIMGGMLLGFIWDIYRLVRRYVKMGAVGTALGDLIYWIVSIYISVQLIFYVSYGNVRMFILLGFVLGALLYFYGISNYILKAFIFVVDFFIKIIRRVSLFMIKPISILAEKIAVLLVPVRVKLQKTRNNAKKRYKFYKFKAKKISKNRKLMYNKKKQSKRNQRLKNKRRKEQTFERRSKNNRTEEKNKP
jgi:spore cortex biosynthesis protein YabQ